MFMPHSHPLTWLSIHAANQVGMMFAKFATLLGEVHTTLKDSVE